MLPPLEDIKAKLEELLPGAMFSIEGPVLYADPKHLAAVCRTLKDNPRFALDYLADVTAVDYPPDPAAGGAGRIEVVYHLYSMAQKHGPLTLKVKLPRATPIVASVTPIWRGAEFQEREAYDLFGVRFEGHPDLRRILMWEGFEGHPMRKDYVPEDQDAAI
jgi:NADH/F420H2 dehydrogenase subunit C